MLSSEDAAELINLISKPQFLIHSRSRSSTRNASSLSTGPNTSIKQACKKRDDPSSLRELFCEVSPAELSLTRKYGFLAGRLKPVSLGSLPFVLPPALSGLSHLGHIYNTQFIPYFHSTMIEYKRKCTLETRKYVVRKDFDAFRSLPPSFKEFEIHPILRNQWVATIREADANMDWTELRIPSDLLEYSSQLFDVISADLDTTPSYLERQLLLTNTLSVYFSKGMLQAAHTDAVVYCVSSMTLKPSQDHLLSILYKKYPGLHHAVASFTPKENDAIVEYLMHTYSSPVINELAGHDSPCDNAPTTDMVKMFESPSCFDRLCFLIQLGHRFFKMEKDQSSSHLIGDAFLNSCCLDFTRRLTEYILFKCGVKGVQVVGKNLAPFGSPVDILMTKKFECCIQPVLYNGEQGTVLDILRTNFPNGLEVLLLKQWELCSSSDPDLFVQFVQENTLTLCGIPFKMMDKKSEKSFLTTRKEYMMKLAKDNLPFEELLDLALLSILQLYKNLVPSGTPRAVHLATLKKLKRVPDTVKLDLEGQNQNDPDLKKRLISYVRSRSIKDLQSP